MTENTSQTLTNDNKRSRDLRTSDSEDDSSSCETKSDTGHNNENQTVLKVEPFELTKVTEQAELITLASKGPGTNGCHYDPSGPNSIRQDKREHNDVHRDKADPKLLILSQAVRITTLYLTINRSQVYQLHQQKNKMRFKSAQRNNKSRPKIPAPAAPKTERAQNMAPTHVVAPLKFQQIRKHLTVVTLYQRINRVQIHQLHVQRNRMKPKLTAQTKIEYTPSQVTQKVGVTMGSNKSDDHKYKQSIVPTTESPDNHKSSHLEKDDLAPRHETGLTSEGTKNDKRKTESNLNTNDAKSGMARTSHGTIENKSPDFVISDDKIVPAGNPVVYKSINKQPNVKEPDDQTMACEMRGQYLAAEDKVKPSEYGGNLDRSDKTSEEQNIVSKDDQHLKAETRFENDLSKPCDNTISKTEVEMNTLEKMMPNMEKTKTKLEEEDKGHLTSKSNTGTPKLLHLRNHIRVATLYQRLDRAQIYQLHEQRNKMKTGQKTNPANAIVQADHSSKSFEDKQDVTERYGSITKQKNNSVKHTDDKKINEPKAVNETSDCDNRNHMSIDEGRNEGKQQKETEHSLKKIDGNSTTNREELNRPIDEKHPTHTSESCINDSGYPKEICTGRKNSKKDEENKRQVEDNTCVTETYKPTANQKTDSFRLADDKKVNDPKTVDEASGCDNEKSITINEEANEGKQQKEIIPNRQSMVNKRSWHNVEKYHTHTYSDDLCIDETCDSGSAKERYKQEDNVCKSICKKDQEQTSNYDHTPLYLHRQDGENGDIVSTAKKFYNIEDNAHRKINGTSFKPTISVGKYCVNENDIQFEMEDSCNMLHAGKNTECCHRNPTACSTEQGVNESAPVSRAHNSHDFDLKPEDDPERLVAMPVEVHENTAQTNDDDNVLSVDGEGIGVQQTMVEDTCITGDEEEDGGLFGILAVYATSQLHVDFLC